MKELQRSKGTTTDFKQQLVFGDSLDGFKEVGVQTKFMFQLLLALLGWTNKDQLRPMTVRVVSKG